MEARPPALWAENWLTPRGQGTMAISILLPGLTTAWPLRPGVAPACFHPPEGGCDIWWRICCCTSRGADATVFAKGTPSSMVGASGEDEVRDAPAS